MSITIENEDKKTLDCFFDWYFKETNDEADFVPIGEVINTLTEFKETGYLMLKDNDFDFKEYLKSKFTIRYDDVCDFMQGIVGFYLEPLKIK